MLSLTWLLPYRSQGHLICSVIRTVLIKLKVAYENVTEHLVGVDDHVQAIIKMLDVGSNRVQFLGIHGMGGVGKTTLAKVVFNTLSSSFHRCCFLADIRESSKSYHGLVNLQKQLFTKVLGSCHQIDEVNDGINILRKGILRKKKLLIVLDDLDERRQLKCLAGNVNWFGYGSRIIITTRDQSVLMTGEEATSEGLVKKSTNILTYDVQEMKFGHALKLFSRHAFRRDSPPDHCVSISKEIVHTLGKLPLALEITGSTLNGKSKAFWADTLKKLKDAPPMQVQEKLMITYERLDHVQKEVFLDIACFFVNVDKTYPLYMWDDCGYHPHDALEVLFLMSLIKIKDNNTFWMHDQVRDLGREIVRQENFKDPSERSRVWKCEEVLSILKLKEGSKKIEALSLQPCQLFQKDIIGKHDEFANLQNLRFFQGFQVSFVGDFNNLLSNLRWLSWQNCPSKIEATNFYPTKLVVLDLSKSNISEEWNGWNQIGEASQLKVLDLSYCNLLKRTPNLSMWVSLERLTLQGCGRLIEIHPSIGKLKLLIALNLKDCINLQEFPEEIICLRALTEIVLPHSRHELPETFGNLQSWLKFPIPNRQIRKLPHWIGELAKLRWLDLSECNYIKELPDSVGKLQLLAELVLSSTSICHLPNSIGNLKQLKILRMNRIREITKLPSAIGLLENLEELYARGCFNMTGKIPEEIGRLPYLRILDLSDTPISGLPITVSCLSNHQTLERVSCLELQLPKLPPNLTFRRLVPHNGRDMNMTVYEQEIVPALPTSFGVLFQLEKLALSCENMQFLSQLPSNLRELRFDSLATTRSPDFSNLRNLSTMELRCCSMPEFPGIFDVELEVLHMELCKFKKLDALFQLEMKRLTSLRMFWCEFLPGVLNLSRMKNLQDVILADCKSLVEIRGLEELGSLCTLSIVHCNSIERMSDLSNLEMLWKLRVVNCPKLRSIEGLNHLESLKELTFSNAGEFGDDAFPALLMA